MKVNQVAPVFHVEELDRSIAFYQGVLGFEEEFRFGTYAGLTMDGFNLHLSESGEEGRPVGGGTVYVFCNDIDYYFKEHVEGKGLNVVQPPADQGYGMRDFVLKDNDGNQLIFGQEIDKRVLREELISD